MKVFTSSYFVVFASAALLVAMMTMPHETDGELLGGMPLCTNRLTINALITKQNQLWTKHLYRQCKLIVQLRGLKEGKRIHY
jgi:hypothetical protein